MATTYRDPVITAIIALLNAEGHKDLKNRFFYGDPLLVNRSQLPAVFISRDSSSIDDEDVATDRSRMKMVINVVYDLTRDFNQDFANINSANAIYEYIEGRNDDFTLKTTSIAYILRKYQQINSHLYINLDVPLELDYGIGVEKRGQGVYTTEGVVRFEVMNIALQPGL